MSEFGWDRHRGSMLYHFETTPEHFARPWRWSTIEATCYVGPGLLLASEVGEMHQAGVLPDWTDDEDESNLLHQRYHLWRWQKENPGLDLSRMRRIQEFGGGYGAMAIVCARLGFRGEYRIYDLPEFELLQDRHLPLRDLPFKVRHNKIHKDPDLLISCFALNEAPVADRLAFLARCWPSNYLIALGGTPIDWFTAWAQRLTDARGPTWHLHAGPIAAESVTYLLSHRGRK